MAKEKGRTITIGSKLPHGLILNHPANPVEKVEIHGLNSAPKGTNGQPIYVPYVTTEVDAEFWAAWKLGHVTNDNKSFKPFASGAIFEAVTPEAAEKVYREREKEKTGLEPLSMRAEGVKPADKE